MKEEILNKKIKLNKIIILILLIILLIISVTVIIKCSVVKNLETNNPSNMGMALAGDDCNFYYKYNSGLIKIKDNEEYQIVNEQTYSLQYLDEYVYYTTPNNNGGIDIKKVKQNGDNNIVLKSVMSNSTKMYLYNGFLYYTLNNPDSIVKIDIYGENEEIIINRKAVDFCVVDDVIYFSDDNGFLYKIGTDGKNYTEIENKIYVCEKFQYLNDKLYYFDQDNNCLMCYDLKKDEKVKVTSKVNCNVYNVTNKGIYYLDSETQKICFVDFKDKKNNELVKVSILNTKINIIGEVLYYLDMDDSNNYVCKRIRTNGKSLDNIKY